MSARNSEANERAKDERRSQITLAALKVFTSKGFAAAKMSDIADEAGISYGLAYHYFRSKEDVYASLIRYAVDSIGRMIDEVQAGESDPAERLRKIIGRVVGSIERKETSGYYYVLVIDALTHGTGLVPSDTIISETTARLGKFADVIAEGQRAGRIRKGDPGELAVAGFSAAVGLAALKVSGVIDRAPDQEILMRMFI